MKDVVRIDSCCRDSSTVRARSTLCGCLSLTLRAHTDGGSFPAAALLPRREVDEAEALAVKRQRPVALRPAIKRMRRVPDVHRLALDRELASRIVAEPHDEGRRLAVFTQQFSRKHVYGYWSRLRLEPLPLTTDILTHCRGI